MSIVSLPRGLLITEQGWGIARHDLTFGAGETGSKQTVMLGPPRLTCSMSSPDRMRSDDGAVWQSLLFDLEGSVNHLAVYDWRNPVPRGTARGTWTTTGPVAAGATVMTVAVAGGVVGATIKRGDWIGVNQGSASRQLLHVQDDAAVVGASLTIRFKHALRSALANGAQVVWDRPTCLMKQTNGDATWSNYGGGMRGGYSLDLVEAWE